MKKTLIAALLSVAFLGACGGGSDSTTSTAGQQNPGTEQPAPTPPVQAGTSTGILTDGPVGGVQYTTSGGYSGVTGADGSYAYNPGETVTFKIGAITLGTVTATGTVTPLDLAAAAAAGDKENVSTNLLVLLQSLDADGDASNGITINDNTKTAAANASIDLTLPPATFASSANSALTTVMNGGGVAKTAPVTEADALAHFRTEFFKQLAGGWVAKDAEGAIAIRIGLQGNYIIGEVGEAVGEGHSGTEVAKIDWNPKTGQVSLVPSSLVHDSNGDWGLDQINGSEVFKVDGDKFTVTDADGTVTTFERVANDPASIVGMWALDTASAMSRQHFTFFPDGTYLMADPKGDDEAIADGRTPCSLGGVEYGNYTFDAATGVLAVTSVAVDTNNCAGAWDSEAQQGLSAAISFSEDKSTFSLGDRTFYRVSK